MSIGNIIKQLRVKYNITQQDLANELSITKSYLSKIEKNERNISDTELMKLSTIFNINLLIIKEFLTKFDSFDELEKYYLLRNLIENKKIDDIEKFINENGNVFISKEAVLQKEYSSALILAIKYKSYEDSINSCYKCLNIDNNTDIDNININIYYNSTLSILVLLIYNLIMLNNYTKSLQVSERVIEYYNTVLHSKEFIFLNESFFFRKTYIIFLNNYAFTLFKNNQLEKALYYCNYAIEQASNFSILNQLYLLLETKMEILYALKNYKGAEEVYYMLKNLCIITNRIDVLENTNNLIKINYDLLNLKLDL